MLEYKEEIENIKSFDR